VASEADIASVAHNSDGSHVAASPARPQFTGLRDMFLSNVTRSSPAAIAAPVTLSRQTDLDRIDDSFDDGSLD